MNFKQQAASAAANLVQQNTTVGLGAGSTIAYLVEFLKEKISNGLCVKFVTSSFTTAQLLLKENLVVQPTAMHQSIDIYFDGCDQFDHELNAVKSGGGIHTQEKLLASMAKEFVLIGDESKLTKTFDIKYPLVLEILPEAISFVNKKIKSLYPGVAISMRMNDKKDGPVFTANGNYLCDLYFESWPELDDINPSCKDIPGIVETSLFFGLANKAIIAGEKGTAILESNFRT